MRLQGGLSTRRSQQQLVARTAKLAVRHGGKVILVSIDMAALCIKLCVCFFFCLYRILSSVSGYFILVESSLQSYHRYLRYKTAKVTLKILFS
jgi:hypothetical protein